jgi:hypothetical protein
MTRELIEVNVSEINGAALNWAVAMAEGYRADPEQEEGDGQTVISPAGIYTSVSKRGAIDGFGYRPSIDWSQGGLLVSKYAVEFEWITDLTIRSELPACGSFGHGRTHLIAACRAIVASVLGPVVSVPKELVHE